MEDNLDIPEESMRHIEALLARHPPHLIQRMFSQAMEAEPRSYPSGLDPTRPAALLTPASDVSSPLDVKREPNFTPTDDLSVASPGGFMNDREQSGDPFMFCTYCAEQKSLKTFKAKSDWKKHEMRMHETGEDWPCIVIGCNRIFDRQKDFVKHHQRYHSGRPLPSLTDIGITLLPRRVFGCGFDKCKEVSIGWDERCDHVAKHMKNGATFEQWKYSNILIGNSDPQLSRSRLASINAALLRVSNILGHGTNFDCGSSPFIEPESPSVDTTGRRISYMDVDPGDFLDAAQPAIPDIPHPMSVAPQIPPPMAPLPPPPAMDHQQQPHTPTDEFNDPAKPPANPLGWCYPSYFDAAPQFEESQYYERPSFGQIISKPLHKIGSRLGGNSRQSSPHSSHMRSSSQMSQTQPDMNGSFAMQNPSGAMAMRQPTQHAQQQQHMPQHHQQHPSYHTMSHPQQQQYGTSTSMQHDQLHSYTNQI
ncbi:hypothetical protein EK21DRAFT_54755 [Setomelanomma holmii]|uniref:C2H2-type domain-containing protein n=1 Tax=Setomelanomma holmii TaxID=210430 RepID=A0A9P4HLB3_9PLEO|nr:hypothetical protein EK21DRAFT_54755 [Setomelanomma holmii]